MELDVWARRSHWYAPHVSIEGLGALLSVRPASVRQYQSTVEGFPPSVKESDGRVRWIEAQVYDYIAAERPHLSHRIPRLYPIKQLRPEPAQFVHGELVKLVSAGTVAVHYWQPSDDRGRIVVAYFGEQMHAREVQAVADEIAARCPWVSAVVVPSDSGARWPDPQFSDEFSLQRHREIAVAQPGQYDAEYDGQVGWLDRFSWSDLANLLRVEVPYWPPGLRNVKAIAAWRPGDDVQTLPPCPRSDSTTAHLRAAFEHSCTASTKLSELLVNVCRYVDYELARDGGLLPETGYSFPKESPGLMWAAAPAVVKDPPPAPTSAQISQLLHQPADARYAEAALRAGMMVGLWAPVVSGSTRLRRSALGPLGQQWRSRLQRVENVSQRNEFGYARIASWLSRPQLDSAIWLRDPLHPDCWIIETHDTVYVTYTTSLPGAQGELTSVQIGVDVGDAFMADSSGTAWLMPRTESDDYGLGYNGGAPRALTVALEDLLADIRCPSAGHRAGGISDDELPSALLELLISDQGPLTLTRAQIEQLIDPSAVDESPSAAGALVESAVYADSAVSASLRADETPSTAAADAPLGAQPAPGFGVMFWPDRAGRMVAVDSRQLTAKSPAPSVPVSYHDLDGQPIDRQAWEQLFTADLAGLGRRLIGSWKSPDGTVRVMTVWTGVSVAERDPLIYHTTIAGGPYADNSVHYRSLADAQFGHARTVTEVQEGRFPWFLIPQ